MTRPIAACVLARAFPMLLAPGAAVAQDDASRNEAELRRLTQ
jgi:hypothetical protein